jgi:hypothetical protein
MDIEPQRDEVVDHILDLLLVRFGLHHHNHELSSDFFRREKLISPRRVIFRAPNHSLSSRAKRGICFLRPSMNSKADPSGQEAALGMTPAPTACSVALDTYL